MAYYESRRAAQVMGVPESATVSANGTSKLSSPIPGLSVSFGRTVTEERSQTLEEAIDAYLRRNTRSRAIARTPYDAVQPTQLFDIVIDLKVGTMPFLRIPGSQYSSKTPSDPRAVWGVGFHENDHPGVVTELILVGSLDGLVGPQMPSAHARVFDFGFPSDPGYMTPALIAALNLDIERDDYVYAMQWSDDPEWGQAAQAASEITRRASIPGPSGSTWIMQQLPMQRVVGSVTDIWTTSDRRRTVLARPALIQSTI